MIAVSLGLAACGDIASQDADAFSTQFKDGQLSGTYNPAGWDSERIQKFISSECPSKKLASYNETPQSNGLIKFVADCA